MRRSLSVILALGLFGSACGPADGRVAPATPPATVESGPGSVDPTPEASTGTPLSRRIVGSMTCGRTLKYTWQEAVVYADGSVRIKGSGRA